MLSIKAANWLLLLLFAATCFCAEGEAGDAADSASEEASDAGQGDASLMLVCTIVFVLTIFYLVNARNAEIRASAWAVINLGTSIFLAVTTYNAVGDVIEWMVDIEEHDPPQSSNLISDIVQLVLWWFFLVSLLGFVSSSQLHLSGYGTVGGHIMGFASLAVFGDLNLMDGFNESAWMTWVVIIIAIVSIALLFLCSKGIGMLLAKCDVIDAEDMDKWHDQCKDTGNDFFALCIGFLLTMFIRCLIIGKFPSVDGSLRTTEDHAEFWLIGVGIIVLLLGVAAKYALHGMHVAEMSKGKKVGSSRNSIITEFLASSLANAAAFSFVFAGMWFWGNETSVDILAYTLNAGLLSIFGALFVIAASMIHRKGVAKRTLRGAFTAISLAVGYGWEKTFDNAVEGLDDLSWFANGGEDKFKTVKFLFTLLILILAFPAWMVYILPKDNDEVKEALKTALSRGSLPCRAVCCDAELYDEEDEEKVPATTVTTMAAPPAPVPAVQSFQYVSVPATQQQYAYQSVPADARSVSLIQPLNVN